MRNTLSASLLAILLCHSNVFAQRHGSRAPDSLSVQGYLTDDVGDPITGPTNLTFKLYKGGVEIWSQTKAGVPVAAGLFNVILGGTGAASLDTVAFNEPIEVGVKVGTDPEMSPRTPLTSAAYALAMRGMYAVYAYDGNGNEAPNLIGGGSNSFVAGDVVGATIGGGGGSFQGISHADSVLGYWGTVSGGSTNVAGGDYSTVGGGSLNKALAFKSTVAGGHLNKATGNFSGVSGGISNHAAGYASTVAGGYQNEASGDSSAVGGGRNNSAGGDGATVGGGLSNVASQGSASVAGGYHNTASASNSSIAGGSGNLASGTASSIGGGAGNAASSTSATVAGGSGNKANGAWSAIPGGIGNRTTGSSSLAAGYKAKAIHDGAFVWNDRSVTSGNDSLVSTAANQFLIRAAGGVGIGTATPKQGLSISRDVEAPAYQLELRNVGDIHGGNFSGIAFTQTASGATENASIKVIYHSNGKPDMSFSVRDAADALFIESVTGNIGIGTTAPATELEVVGTITETSDARFKRDVSPIGHAMSLVEGLRGVTFEWDQEAWPDRGFSSGRQMGLIAQEVREVVPEVVRQGDDGHYAVAYAKLVPLLIEAIKEQQTTIDTQSERIAELERRMMP